MRSRSRSRLSAGLALSALCGLLLGPTTEASAASVDVEVMLGGGSVMAWATPGDIGNGFGGAVLFGVDDFAVGVAGAAVLPDGRVQGQIGVLWAEARWSPLGRGAVLSPYVAAGVGLATADDVENATPVASGSRWASDGPSPLAVLGVGLRYGDPEGLGIALDLRAYNHTHGGLHLLASYAF